MADKLVCDKCGYELTDVEDVYLALDGMEAWQDAQRARGIEPRGIFPCKYYFQCQGEMFLVRETSRKKKPPKEGK
jgi:hypothetical protein